MPKAADGYGDDRLAAFSLKADIAATAVAVALEIFEMFSHCRQDRKRALFMPILSY